MHGKECANAGNPEIAVVAGLAGMHGMRFRYAIPHGADRKRTAAVARARSRPDLERETKPLQGGTRVGPLAQTGEHR